MEIFTFWKILGIVALVMLIIFWRKRGAIWGGMTLGVIVALIIVVVFVFRGNGFDWRIIGKGAILGTFAGLIAELIGRVSDKIKKKK